jgi:molybdopterin converting factor small subunit
VVNAALQDRIEEYRREKENMGDGSRSASKDLPVSVVTIKLPTAFHALTGGQRRVSVEGDDIREVLAGLNRTFPGILDRIVDEEGSVRRYVTVCRNDIDIRSLDGLETKVNSEDEIWIIPAVAGGTGVALS